MIRFAWLILIASVYGLGAHLGGKRLGVWGAVLAALPADYAKRKFFIAVTIASGEVNGIRLSMVASLPFGSCIKAVLSQSGIINGKSTKKVNWTISHSNWWAKEEPSPMPGAPNWRCWPSDRTSIQYLKP